MVVCYLADNGSVHNQKWIEALSKIVGLELHVIAFKRGVEFNHVHYHFLKRHTNNKLDYVLNVPALKELIRKIKPDLLHAHYATSYGFMGSATGFHPCIITGWGADIFDSSKNPVMKMILQRSFRKADAITVLSEITLREMKKLSVKHVELIPFGVDIQLFAPSEKKPDGIFRIGTIRTLTEKYGVEFLIRAFALLHPNYPNVRLEIVGDGKLRSSLEDLAVTLGVKDRIIFHGYINQKSHFQDYYRILSGFDVFCIPSILDSETFGVAAVEACSCGIPVVASRIGGLTEVIEDGITGMLVPAKDHVQISKAIEKLIVDPELKMRMGKEARSRTEAHYNWDESVNKMLSVYKKVLVK